MRFVLILLLLSRAASADDCAVSFADLDAKLESSAAKLNLPLNDPSLRKRFLASVDGMSDDQIRALFNSPRKLSFDDIDKIWWAGQTRDVKMSQQALARISFLREVGRRDPSLFQAGADLPLRFRQAAKAALEGPATLDQSLAQYEETLLLQAILEGRGIRNSSNKWYDRFLNFFSPHADRMNQMIAFNNNVRKSVQQLTVADEPVADTLARLSGSLDPADKAKLEGLLSDTQTLIKKPLGELKTAYGRDVTEGGALEVGDVRLRAAAGRMEKVNAKADFDASVRRTEKDMDVVDEVEEHARQRAGLAARTIHDVNARELQIRETQWKREMGELQAQHDGALGKTVPNSDYDVRASWTVTVQHEERKTHMVPKTRTKPDGSIENYQEEETYYERWTSTYTESGSFTLDADYREVLGGHVSPSAGRVSSMLPSAQPRGMYAVSATNGSPTIDYVDNGKISRILDSAKVARAVEKPVRDEMDAVDDLTKKIAADYAKGDLAAKKDGYVKQIQAARDEVAKLRQQSWDAYRNKTDADIKRDWPNDTVENFRQRAKLMEERYARLQKFLINIEEEVDRALPDLEIRYSLPNYDRQVAELDRIRRRARIIQGTGAGVATTAAGGGGYYVSDDGRREDLGQKLQDMSDRVKKEMGL